MNLKQLELFIAVAEGGSFSRGAESALRTQSTVSQQIAGLETELGLRLFDRTGRGAELTAGGEILFEQARRVQAQMAELQQAMARFQGLEETGLTIGASTIPGTYLLPHLLPQLLRRHPGIVLSVFAGDSRQILERLVAGALELALVGHRQFEGECSFIPIDTDLLVLAVGPGHPWWEKKRITADELLREPLLLRESGSGSGQALFSALREHGIDQGRLKIVAHLGSSEAIKEALLNGCGAAFLSEMAVRREVARGELHLVAVDGLRVNRQLWLATRSGRSLSPAAEAFIALLRPTPTTG